MKVKEMLTKEINWALMQGYRVSYITISKWLYDKLLNEISLDTGFNVSSITMINSVVIGRPSIQELDRLEIMVECSTFYESFTYKKTLEL